MTTAGLPDTSTYTTREFVSCLVTPSACAYGSEGWSSNPFGRADLAVAGRLHLGRRFHLLHWPPPTGGGVRRARLRTFDQRDQLRGDRPTWREGRSRPWSAYRC